MRTGSRSGWRSAGPCAAQHSHIVPLLSAGQQQGLTYYTMPFIEGESLRGV
ncbi:MAG: hypothetical protein ACREON_17660 [Gemmatimonadaceae bacterium]